MKKIISGRGETLQSALTNALSLDHLHQILLTPSTHAEWKEKKKDCKSPSKIFLIFCNFKFTILLVFKIKFMPTFSTVEFSREKRKYCKKVWDGSGSIFGKYLSFIFHHSIAAPNKILYSVLMQIELGKTPILKFLPGLKSLLIAPQHNYFNN